MTFLFAGEYLTVINVLLEMEMAVHSDVEERVGKMHLLLTGVLLVGLSGQASAENPHQAADRCFDQFTADCDHSCGLCHQTIGLEPPVPPSILDFYREADSAVRPAVSPYGDLILCLECHAEKQHPDFNHPVGIPYNMDLWERDFYPLGSGRVGPGEGEREMLAPPPGPRLYCGDSECWIFCTTCHNPHRGRIGMLRTPYSITDLCMSCHRK